jgi:hypothetical protein
MNETTTPQTDLALILKETSEKWAKVGIIAHQTESELKTISKGIVSKLELASGSIE